MKGPFSFLFQVKKNFGVFFLLFKEWYVERNYKRGKRGKKGGYIRIKKKLKIEIENDRLFREAASVGRGCGTEDSSAASGLRFEIKK